MTNRMVFALISWLALAACQPAAPDLSPDIPRDGDRVVAVVNDSPIHATDVQRAAAAQGLIAPDEALSPGTDAFSRTLDGLIDQRLLAQDAVATGLLEDEEAARRLAAARERILGNLRVERMLSATVTDEALDALYAAQNKLARGGPERRLRQIVVEDMEAAAALAERIDDGEDFAELAREVSTDTASAERGGELGWTTRGALPAPLREPVFALSDNARTKPIRTPAGYHIVEVMERRSNASGGPSFEEVREDLARFMTLEAVEKLMTDLRENADIIRGEALDDLAPSDNEIDE